MTQRTRPQGQIRHPRTPMVGQARAAISSRRSPRPCQTSRPSCGDPPHRRATSWPTFLSGKLAQPSTPSPPRPGSAMTSRPPICGGNRRSVRELPIIMDRMPAERVRYRGAAMTRASCGEPPKRNTSSAHAGRPRDLGLRRDDAGHRALSISGGSGKFQLVGRRPSDCCSSLSTPPGISDRRRGKSNRDSVRSC
jgi:hypothetical protein